jgi:DNA-binding beta-propeller fold protein YncE
MRVARRIVCVAALLATAIGGCAPSTSSKSTPQPVVIDEDQVKPQVQETTDVVEKPENPVTTAREPDPPDELMPADPYPKKKPVPAEALEGGVEWLNTAEPITLDSVRGKVVLLDFWTYCCINCMHVLPDLKKLEEKYAKQLVVIGVHSAKFETERESQNIREAILRYEIKHPVVNDANMIIWRHFGVNAWPTMWLIDPEGNAVGYLSAEGVYDHLDQAIDSLVKYHRAKGTLNENPIHFELESSRVADTPLRFPGKVLADAASDRLFIADSNHNRIVISTLGGKLIDVVGTGDAGKSDGDFESASFFRPHGLALDGDTLYVADTENHMIRRIDLKGRSVSTVAGTGSQGTSRSHWPRPAKVTALNSPWDLCLHEGKLYIAMAGPHQIWLWNQQTDEIHAFAGSGREDIEDGELQFSAFAQPSGLASDGEWLYVADSEGSSIRAVPLIPEKEVWTVVGTADLDAGRLFEFGDVDGENGKARLQHPLGVAWHNGALYVADTYNNKIKAIDPEKRFSITYLGTGEPGKADDPAEFDEPAGLSVAGEKLYIADTNNHTIRVVDLTTNQVSTLAIDGLTPPKRPDAP